MRMSALDTLTLSLALLLVAGASLTHAEEPSTNESNSSSPPAEKKPSNLSPGTKTLPSSLHGTWKVIQTPTAKEDADPEQLVISEDSLIWTRSGEATTVPSSKIEVDNNGRRLRFGHNLIYARGAFGGGSSGAKVKVSITLQGQKLRVSIPAFKQKADTGGLMAWSSGTTISRTAKGKTVVSTVSRPAETRTFVKAE